jgi:acyl-coenzyme A thioesterase PaaI-like protein
MTSLTKNVYSKNYGHYNCFLCGEHNRWGLGLKFELLDDGRVHTKFKPPQILQGYKGILHGGVISALMDCAMVHCLFHNVIEAVTADLDIRFIHSIPINIELDLYGEIVEKKRKLFYMRSNLTHNEKVMAQAKAKFLLKKEIDYDNKDYCST